MNATVRITPVDGPSRIDVCYNNVKEINVYLNIGSEQRVNNFRQSVLRDFVSMVAGYSVMEFEASDLISMESVRLFLRVCDRHLMPNTRRMMPNTRRHPLSMPYSRRQPVPHPHPQHPVPQPVPHPQHPVPQRHPHPQPVPQHEAIRVILNTMSNIDSNALFPAINSDESDPPIRFVVNDREQREVLHTDNTNITLPSIINTVPAPTHPTTLASQQRVGRSQESINTVARAVHLGITNTSVIPPDFSNHTRRGYRKIKNFIHNLTKVWLTHSETDMFISAFNLLN